MTNLTSNPVSRQTKPSSSAAPSASTVTPKQPIANCDTSSPDSSTAELANTMPPRNPQRPTGRGAVRREVDLSGLITPAQKTELVRLVGALTDSMRQQICSIWEAQSSHSAPSSGDPVKANVWSAATNPNDGKHAGPSLLNGTLPAALVNKLDDKDLWKCQLELRKDVIVAFKKWHTGIVKRTNDISAGREYPQSNRQGRTRPLLNPLAGKQPAKAPPPAAKPGASSGNTTQKEGQLTSMAEENAAFQEAYRPAATSLSCLPTEKRTLLLHSMCLLFLSLENYSAYTRVLLLHMALSLQVPLHSLQFDEGRLARGLSKAMDDLSAEVLPPRGEENKTPRRGRPGSGAASAPNVGLAAALGAVGVGTVGGGASLGKGATAGLLGGLADSSFLQGTLFGLYGGRGAGKMMESYTRDIPDIALLPLHGSLPMPFREARAIPTEDRRLRLTIAASGWVGGNEDVLTPWKILGNDTEAYVWKWEGEAMVRMGDALETVVKSAAWSMAKKEIGPAIHSSAAKHSGTNGPVFASLYGDTWPASLLRISKIIDGPWSVGMVRADKAGIVLADAILNKVQGERGVTLIGYGLGARVVYTCLMSLAERRVFGVVENAVLMGAPVPSDERSWSALRSVVAGRLINVYSRNDYLLGFLYRTSSIQFGVAGLQRVEAVPAVKNVDATDVITVHLRYRHLVGRILDNIGWEDLEHDQISREEDHLRLVEAKLAQDARKRECLPGGDTPAALPAEPGKKKKKNRGKKDASKTAK